MHARPIAIATTVIAGAFLLLGPPRAPDPIRPRSFVDLPAGGVRVYVPRELPRPGPFPDARPCLIDTVRCLELSPEPFAPCLLTVERCRGEWRLHPLIGIGRSELIR